MTRKIETSRTNRRSLDRGGGADSALSVVGSADVSLGVASLTQRWTGGARGLFLAAEMGSDPFGLA